MADAPVTFDSMEAAVQAALQEAVHVTKDRKEVGGVIFERDGKFFYSPPANEAKRGRGVTDSRKGQFRVKVQVPKGAKVRGVYHNHPSHSGRSSGPVFSPDDVNMSNQLGVPSYITFGGEMRVFDPSAGDKVDGHKGAANGRPFVIEEKPKGMLGLDIEPQAPPPETGMLGGLR
jgi:hypothetical protein